MYLLTASGTFTASQYESIVESTKQAIDGLLNVFTALMPVYAILGAAMFGIAFVLLLIHVINVGCDLDKVSDSYESKTDIFERVNATRDNDNVLDRANAILNSDDEFESNMRSEDFFKKYYDPDDDTYRKRRYHNW